METTSREKKHRRAKGQKAIFRITRRSRLNDMSWDVSELSFCGERKSETLASFFKAYARRLEPTDTDRAEKNNDE